MNDPDTARTSEEQKQCAASREPIIEALQHHPAYLAGRYFESHSEAVVADYHAVYWGFRNELGVIEEPDNEALLPPQPILISLT